MKRKILSVFIVITVAVMLFGTISVSAYEYEYDVEIDKLSALVEEAEKFEFEHYSISQLTWAVFQNKLNNARTLVDSVYIIPQDEIDIAYNELNQAIENLGPSSYVETEPVDTSELEALIAEAASWEYADFNVDIEKWLEFQAEIDVARSVFQIQNFTQQSVDAVKNNLALVMEMLEPFRKAEELPNIGSSQIQQTEMPPMRTDIAFQPIVPNGSDIVLVPNSPIITTPVKETRPKSTTPFLQGGFIEIGCDASIAISALVVVGIIGAAVAIKKKED